MVQFDLSMVSSCDADLSLVKPSAYVAMSASHPRKVGRLEFSNISHHRQISLLFLISKACYKHLLSLPLFERLYPSFWLLASMPLTPLEANDSTTIPLYEVQAEKYVTIALLMVFSDPIEIIGREI